MIKSLLFLYGLIYLFQVQLAFGTIWVVSNQPGSEASFSSVQSAVEYASAFDTIYVKGSPLNYGNILLEKPLVLLGENPEAKDYSGHTAKLTRILLTSNPYRGTSASGSSIVGFEFPYFPGQRANIITVSNRRIPINNITIERNWLWFIDIVGNAENWMFKNNIIRGWVNGTAQTADYKPGAKAFYFHNNVLNSLKGFEKGDVLIQNNIIMGRLLNVYGARVLNNVFTREDYLLENVSGSEFFNNVALGSMIGDKECYEQADRFDSGDRCTGGKNMGSRNQVGVDPGFVYWPTNDIMRGAVFELRPGAVARNAGQNGIQAGIYGGKYPFPVKSFLMPEIKDPFPSFVTSIY